MKMKSKIVFQKVYRKMRFYKVYTVYPITSEITFLTIRTPYKVITLTIPGLMEPV